MLVAAALVLLAIEPAAGQRSNVSPFAFKNLSNGIAGGLTVDLNLEGNCRVLAVDSPAFSGEVALRRTVRLDGGRVGRREPVEVLVRHNCATAPSVDLWWWTDAEGRRLSERFRGPQDAGAQFSSIQEPSELLQRLTFVTPEGRLELALPLEVLYGSQVSGSLRREPAGDGAREVGRNRAALAAYSLDLAGIELPGSQGTWSRSLPEAPQGGEALVPVRLWSGNGQLMAANSVPAGTPDAQATEPQLPLLTESGRPFRIQGPFDGDLSNTRIAFGSTALSVLAESPQGLVAMAPASAGVQDLEVSDQGRTSGAPVRNVRVTMTAPKESLAIGESLDLQFRVTGLRGLDVPLKITVRNLSFALAHFLGQQRTPEIVVRPRDVAGDGSYTFTLALQGTQGGVFEIETSISY